VRNLLASAPATETTNTARMPPTQSAPSLHLKHVSPERLLVGDAIIALRLLNEARRRVVGAVFGVPREGSSVVTLIAIGAFARALHRIAAAPSTQARKMRSSPTAVGDTMIGAVALREAVDRVAGRPSRDVPFAVALITFAVLTHAFRPAIAGSLRALRGSFRAVIAEALRLRAEFTARAVSGRYDD
jgi:hypothetical protein